MNEQMSNTRFLQYTSYFGQIAQAGMWSAESLRGLDNIIQNVNVDTFDIMQNAIESKIDLIANFQTAYSNVSLEAYSVGAWRLSFVALSDHIREWTGGSIDDYLTDQDIQVNKKYAQIVPSQININNVKS